MTTSTTKPEKPAAYIFGERPETVSEHVKFKSITGKDVDIECQFKYRDRVEFAAFWDEISDAKPPELKDGEQFSFERLAKHGLEASAERALQFLKAWPLELELNKENLMRLFLEEQVAAAAFWEAYRKVSTEGRVGN